MGLEDSLAVRDSERKKKKKSSAVISQDEHIMAIQSVC